ncbi:hypothetical protein XBKB1_2460003 [Xenorhabdus bovienii str. kraussei Becker Underwood]|uniref:Uncharacterized protein n=1 Tax=Xenorhabdus bovienii str. kraussei Becker Underwood TaxID=1398204 RepID=A0A077PII8_XENBV|nr:hypothetical protein XBKB1_2460003 [Xenorhabdus bovienii str. kraussei Becker Underwood]
MGGLAENKVEEGETGFSFLPKGFLTGKSKANTKTDITHSAFQPFEYKGLTLYKV